MPVAHPPQLASGWIGQSRPHGPGSAIESAEGLERDPRGKPEKGDGSTL
jgi:hypothetical protein